MAKRTHKMETLVGFGSQVHGDLEVNGSVHIAGKVEGSVIATGFVTVAETGVVGGGIQGEHAVIHGRVGGDVRVKGKVLLGSQARLKGDITAVRLAIEDGAVFEGHSNMIDETETSVPQSHG